MCPDSEVVFFFAGKGIKGRINSERRRKKKKVERIGKERTLKLVFMFSVVQENMTARL